MNPILLKELAEQIDGFVFCRCIAASCIKYTTIYTSKCSQQTYIIFNLRKNIV